MNAMMKLALLLGLVVGCVNAVCPPNFFASITIPGKCYYLTATNDTFFSAINYCRNNLTYGADILSIANEFENSEAASLVQSRGISYALIGNAFYGNKSHWIATAASSSNYSNWGSGTYNGKAAYISSSGYWGSTDGDNLYPAICQIYPDDPTTFPPPQITCPAGWTPSISVRGKCYGYIGVGDFFAATRACLTTKIGGSHAELVTLTSQLEMMELFEIGLRYTPWVSLTSWEADGYWHWVETLHPTDYFGPYGQPTDYGGTCACTIYSGLYGAPCWHSGAAICQYFPDEPPAPAPPGLDCPQNGIPSITKPGTCYYVLSQHKSFQSAQSACQKLNNGFNYNDLFVPRTALEYEEFEGIVLSQISCPLFWLELTNSNGNWDWITDRSRDIVKTWCGGRPNPSQNPNNRCGFVTFSNGFFVEFCWTAGNRTDSYAAICQSTSTF